MTDLAAYEAIRDAISAIIVTADQVSPRDRFVHFDGPREDLLNAPERSFLLVVTSGPMRFVELTQARTMGLELRVAYDDAEGSEARILGDNKRIEDAIDALRGTLDHIEHQNVTRDFMPGQTHLIRQLEARYQEG